MTEEEFLATQEISPQAAADPLLQKSLAVTLLGPPNSGKSTMLNYLTRDKLAATSSKAQTTRRQVLGISTRRDTQLVLVDTPGIVAEEKQRKIDPLLPVASWSALAEAEFVIVMFDASRKKVNREVYKNLFAVLDRLKADLEKAPEPLEAILVLNKMDAVLPTYKRDKKAEKLQKAIFEEYPFFSRCFPVSVRSKIGLAPFLAYVESRAKSRPWEFPPAATSMLSDHDRVSEIIREQLFRRFNQEVPYGITMENTDWTVLATGHTRVEFTLTVDKKAHKHIIIAAIGEVVENATNNLRQMFGKEFMISLNVKSRKK